MTRYIRYLQSFSEVEENGWIIKTPTVKNPCSLLLLAKCALKKELLCDNFPYHYWQDIHNKVESEIYNETLIVKPVNKYLPKYNLEQYNPRKRSYHYYEHVPCKNLGNDKWLRVRRKLTFGDD